MPFRVDIHPSGHSFEVADGETILDAALRHGLLLPYGCRDGACGSCLGRVVCGEFSYPSGPPEALNKLPAEAGSALFCQAVPASDLALEVREIVSAGDIRPRKLPCRVAKMEHLAEDVVRLYLKIPGNERMQFLAGQHIDFLLKDGRRRTFSIANAAHDDAFIELHIRHVDGGEFTGYVFDQMQEKTILRIEGPYGSFFLREHSQRPILLVGGGTGFAPLKSIVEHAFHIGLDRPMHLFWGVRARRDLYLPDLPEQWAREHPNFQWTPVLSEPQPDDQWEGETGWVHEAVLRQYASLSAHALYLSGPPVMIDAAKAAFITHGLPEHEVYYDSFEFAADRQQKSAD